MMKHSTPTHAQHGHASTHHTPAASNHAAAAASASSMLAASSSFAAAAAVAASAASASAAAAAASSAAASSPLLVDLVRKLASFRRGLLLERKQRQLLELSLEEALLKQDQLILHQREQDVQLLTSLELCASLEHALSMSAVEPLQTHSLHEKELAALFAKPKAESEAELRRLFAELATIQQYYHILEKKSLADRVAAESTQLKLHRDLKTSMDGAEKASQEARKFKIKCSELIQEITEMKEESQRKQTENEAVNQGLKQQIEALHAQLGAKQTEINALQIEMEEARTLSESLANRASSLSSKVDTLELTVRHFTCTRILPHSPGHNVSCEISIKKIPLTGELLLCVKDTRIQNQRVGLTTSTGLPLPPMVHAAAASGGAGASGAASSAAGSSSSLLLPGELDGEYQQELSSVRCRAVDEELVRSHSMGADGAGMPAAPRVEVDALPALPVTLPDARIGIVGATPTSAAAASGHAGALASAQSGTILLGYRPRFVLCFTGDNHRCMIFETHAQHYRHTVCSTLQHFIRITQDQHVDELGRFFGHATAATPQIVQ